MSDVEDALLDADIIALRCLTAMGALVDEGDGAQFGAVIEELMQPGAEMTLGSVIWALSIRLLADKRQHADPAVVTASIREELARKIAERDNPVAEQG